MTITNLHEYNRGEGNYNMPSKWELKRCKAEAAYAKKQREMKIAWQKKNQPHLFDKDGNRIINW